MRALLSMRRGREHCRPRSVIIRFVRHSASARGRLPAEAGDPARSSESFVSQGRIHPGSLYPDMHGLSQHPRRDTGWLRPWGH